MPSVGKKPSAAKAKASKPLPSNSRSTRSSVNGNTLSTIPETTDKATTFSNQQDGLQPVDTAVADPFHKGRPRRANAGTGGRRDQLEAIGDAIMATPYQRTRARFTIPDDEPVNVMAPTPRKQRKKVSKTPAGVGADLVSRY